MSHFSDELSTSKPEKINKTSEPEKSTSEQKAVEAAGAVGSTVESATSSVTESAEPAEPAAEPAAPLFRRGDLVKIPCHGPPGAHFTAEVVHVYDSLEDAEKRYPKSFRTILQAPYKKPEGGQYFYYCEVNNTQRKPVGVAEEHAELKRRA